LERIRTDHREFEIARSSSEDRDASRCGEARCGDENTHGAREGE
jgi:hypothetical protein